MGEKNGRDARSIVLTLTLTSNRKILHKKYRTHVLTSNPTYSYQVTKVKLIENPRLMKKIMRYNKKQEHASQYSQMDAEDIEDEDDAVYMAE